MRMESRPRHSLRLLDLPNELIIHIIQCLDDDTETLRETCLVNRLFYTYAEPLIKVARLVRGGEDGDELIGDLTDVPRRACWISRLTFAYPEKYHVQGPSFFPGLARMKNLQHLVIEATDFPDSQSYLHPQFPSEQEEISKIFIRASLLQERPSERLLPNLQTLELQYLYDNHNLWDLSTSWMVFLHPTLRSLTLGCAGWSYTEHRGRPRRAHNLDILSKFRSTTPLKSLTFEQCDICLVALAAILSVPKSLTDLKIHEPRHYHNPRGYGLEKRHRYLEAMAPQARSLRSLSFSLSDEDQRSHLYADHTDWSPFTALIDLAVAPVHILLGDINNYSHLDLRNILGYPILPLPHTLPPKLRQLTVWDMPSWRDPSGALLTLICTSHMPTLNEVTFQLKSLSFYLHHRRRVPFGGALSTPSLSSLSDEISAFASEAQKHGVRVKLECLLKVSTHIPPYLYGETPSRRECMFDSSEAGWERVPHGKRAEEWLDIERGRIAEYEDFERFRGDE